MSSRSKQSDANPTPLSIYSDPCIDILSVARPPDGYRMERILCFSYSLDASVAIALLCSAFGVGDRDLDPRSASTGLNKFDQIRFLKNTLQKSLFVIQHSEDPIRGVSDLRNDVSAGLQDRVFAVQRAREHFVENSSDWINFHPKVILVEFRRKGLSWLRAYIGSKNLSLGAALEGGVLVEMPPADVHLKSRPLSSSGFTAPLSDFLKATRIEGLQHSKKAKSDTARHIIELDYWESKLAEAKGRKLYTSGSIESLTLVGQYPGGQPLSVSLNKDLKSASKTTVISPWCDLETTKWLLTFKPRLQDLALWVLESERSNLAPLEGQAHRVETHAVANVYDTDTEGEVAAQDWDLRHHAKMCVIDRSSQTGLLWVGSANWTRPGIGLNFSGKENFEIMARLEVKGKASALLGEIDTVPIDETDTTTDAKEEPLTKAERVRRLLHWFQVEWRRYPNELSIQLLVTPPKNGYGDLGLKTIIVEVRKTFEDGEFELFHEIPWRALLSGKPVIVEAKKPFPKKLILDSTIRLSTNLGSQKGLVVHCLVPVPDQIAALRTEELKSRTTPTEEDIFERLISIQEGVKRRLSKPIGSGEGGGSSIDSYLRKLRLEKVFLQLSTDPDSFEENIEDLRNIQEQLAVEIQKNKTRTELIELADSLNFIVSEALSIRGKRKESHAS